MPDVPQYIMEQWIDAIQFALDNLPCPDGDDEGCGARMDLADMKQDMINTVNTYILYG